MISKGDKSKMTHHIFESVSEYVQYAIDGDGYRNKKQGFVEAVRMSKEGWPDGHKNIVNSVSGSLDHLNPVEGDGLVPTVAGPIFNIDAMVAEQPEQFYNFDEVEDNRPVLKLACQFSAQGFFNAQAFLNRGSAVLSLVEILERSGIPVELWGYANTQSSDGTDRFQRIDVKIKTSGEPLDVDRIAYVLAHEDWYREIGFAVKERLCNEKGEDYGLANRSRSFELRDSDFDVVTPYSKEFLRSPVLIRNWIKETCNRLGLQVELAR